MHKKKRWIIILLLIIIVASLLLYFLVIKNQATDAKVLDTIEKFGYHLEDRDTFVMKENFNKLKEILSADNIDYENYASTLSKIFIIDLYTMSNKLGKYDVGGVEYIYQAHQENYIINVQNTLYKYMENESLREDEMPEVSSIKVESINEQTYTYQEIEYPAYAVSLSWEYKKDLGYEKTAKITVINIDDKLYISEVTSSEDSQ